MSESNEQVLTNEELRTINYEWINRLEIKRDTVIDTIAVWGPLAAPLVPAGLTAAAIVDTFPALLGIEVWAAVAIASVTVIVLEVLGIVGVETWLEMRRFNAELNDETSEAAPERQALSIVCVYSAIVLALVFVLKIWHGIALYSLVPLTLLGLITSWTIVLRKQHNRRLYLLGTEQQRKNHLNELLSALNEKQTELASKQAALDELQAAFDSVQHELGSVQQQLCNVQHELNVVRNQSNNSTILTELTDAQRDKLKELLDIVQTNRIESISDLVSAGMNRNAAYQIWPVAIAGRFIDKNGDGAYHTQS